MQDKSEDLQVERQIPTGTPPVLPVRKRSGNNDYQDQEWGHDSF